ncbi:MAG: helix-turn-helix domain-containing protein [Treponema sp.]|jgi:transcriptional regulator with XRE-family HTH domain|nr:helix-turn-helix domain-containing protein [Treponema sp.]
MIQETELRGILSANIKYYRSLRNWSQVKLAEKIDISTNFLADIETGKSWVSSLTLVKLANVFEINVYELFVPEKEPGNDVKEAIKGFIKDVSVTIDCSLEKISRKYLI